METKKYTVGTVIYRYKRNECGRWTNYTDALKEDERELLKYAQSVGYVQSDNIAPRGGKHGEIYRVKKYFTTNSLTRKRDADVKSFNKKLASVLKSEKDFEFSTVSDVGSFKIDGDLYKNFYGDGMNRVEVCKCDADEFEKAETLSRRQIYNPKTPITIVKYDNPKTIIISKCDVDDSFGSVSIDNVLGFCIWERKLKIFTK